MTRLEEIWFEKIIDTYHRESKRFCMEEKDRFLNPIGSSYRESVKVIVEELFGSFSGKKVASALEDMVKIGCLHGYSYSSKEGYIALLKNVIKEYLKENLDKEVKRRLDELHSEEGNIFGKTKEKIERLRERGISLIRHGRPK
jgi:hypothetical protein